MFKNRLKNLRKIKGVTQEQLALAIGVERSSIGKYEGKQNVIPSSDILNAMAEYFNVSIDYLLGRDDTPNHGNRKGVKIPVLGSVAAGIPIEAITDIIDYEEIDEEMASKGDYFALQIKGRSMEPRICEGDVVIIKRQDYVDNGQLAIVIINGDEATCKKVVYTPSGMKLMSINPLFEPMFYTADEIENLPITILGRVVELRGKF